MTLNSTKQKQFEPSLQGPFKPANAPYGQVSTFRSVKQVSSCPWTVIRVSASAVDLLMSFESPPLKFKKDVVDEGADVF